MGSSFTTNIGIFFLNQLARLPFRTLYIISDTLFLFIYYIAGYRKKTVITNLKNSFPEKSKREIQIIARKFFRHLGDLMVEVIKMNGMTRRDYFERMKFINPELINNYYQQGRSVTVLTMHYNNWEWSSCVPLYLEHTILGVYKPLHNERFDKYLNQSRSKTGATMISNSQVLRTVIAADRKKEPVFLWLAADQTPPVFHKFWMMFLNQEALFYPGPAAISKRFKHPVFFQKIEKTGRGRYQSTFELLIEKPEEKSETEIMKAFIDKMEQVIRSKPEYYLWSHKRWKHKRPADVPIQQ